MGRTPRSRGDRGRPGSPREVSGLPASATFNVMNQDAALLFEADGSASFAPLTDGANYAITFDTPMNTSCSVLPSASGSIASADVTLLITATSRRQVACTSGNAILPTCQCLADLGSACQGYPRDLSVCSWFPLARVEVALQEYPSDLLGALQLERVRRQGRGCI